MLATGVLVAAVVVSFPIVKDLYALMLKYSVLSIAFPRLPTLPFCEIALTLDTEKAVPLVRVLKATWFNCSSIGTSGAWTAYCFQFELPQHGWSVTVTRSRNCK